MEPRDEKRGGWWAEGTAGRPAYLNRIDDPSNADPAHTPSHCTMRGRGLIDSPGLGGEKGSAACPSRCCQHGGVDGSPHTTMAITRANPEVSPTAERRPAAEPPRSHDQHVTAAHNKNWIDAHCSIRHAFIHQWPRRGNLMEEIGFLTVKCVVCRGGGGGGASSVRDWLPSASH